MDMSATRNGPKTSSNLIQSHLISTNLLSVFAENPRAKRSNPTSIGASAASETRIIGPKKPQNVRARTPLKTPKRLQIVVQNAGSNLHQIKSFVSPNGYILYRFYLLWMSAFIIRVLSWKVFHEQRQSKSKTQCHISKYSIKSEKTS